MEVRYQAHTNMATHELRSITVRVAKGDYVISSKSGTVIPRNTSGGLCDGKIKDAVIKPVEKGGAAFNVKWLEKSSVAAADYDVSDPLTDEEPYFVVEMLLVVDDKGKKTICSYAQEWNRVQAEKQRAKEEMMKKLREGVRVEELGKEMKDAQRRAHEAQAKASEEGRDACFTAPGDKRL